MQRGSELSGRYVLEELLGHGNVGEVWCAKDRALDREVAVKVVWERISTPELANGLKREARLAARLQHPGITVVHDVGEHRGQTFIVMELLNGRDLQAVLSGYPGGLAPNAAIALVTQAAEALQSAHDGSVIHRDLKPGNLFLQRSGQLKICDFGIAVAADTNSSLKADSYVLGTPAYMSPEQCDGLQGDERSDLYSLGCVLYALLTGRPPFPSGQPLAIMAHHRTTSPQSPDNVRQGIRPEVAKLVMQLLAKDPKRRPPSAQWVAAMLQAQLTRETTKAPGVKDTGAERHRFGATSGTGDSRSWPAATDEQDAVTRRRLMIAYEDYCLAQVAWEDANPARRGPEPRWEDYRARAFNSP